MNQQYREDIRSPIGRFDELDRVATWREVLLSLGPFLLLPLYFVLGIAVFALLGIGNYSETFRPLYLLFGMGFFVILWIALLVAWLKDFPRWTFPYWGFVLLIVIYFSNFTGTVFGYDFTGDWWVWLAVLAVPAIVLLWRRSLQPLYELLNSLWRDWTLLSFAFYGALPLFLILAYEDVDNTMLMRLVSLLILAAGAVVYMRSAKTWLRFAGLLAGFLLAWAVTLIYLAFYWNGRLVPVNGVITTWRTPINWNIPMIVTESGFLLAPLLLAAVHWLLSSTSRLKTAHE